MHITKQEIRSTLDICLVQKMKTFVMNASIKQQMWLDNTRRRINNKGNVNLSVKG